MEIDFVGIFESMMRSWWMWTLSSAATISFYWYYIRQTHKVIMNKEARESRSLLKYFLVGQPLTLLAILIVVIGIISVLVYVFNITLP